MQDCKGCGSLLDIKAIWIIKCANYICQDILWELMCNGFDFNSYEDIIVTAFTSSKLRNTHMRAPIILYGAKQLPAKIQPNCYLEPLGTHILVRCSSKVNKFHLWKWIWKWCQFCLGLNMFIWNWLHCNQLTLKQAFASIMGIICHKYYMFDIIYVFQFRTMYSIDIRSYSII